MRYNKTKLKNGLRVLTVPMKETKTATVMIMTGVGSRFETEKEAGISHFLEHMMFKGTEKRPDTLTISEELDSMAGEVNAFTGKEYTGYYAKVDGKHILKALDVVSDMFLNSKIEQEEIDRERGTILQELNMYEDTPMRNVGDIFETLLYDGNNLGRDIIGYKKTINSVKREDFVDYMNRFYVGNNTVVCVAGNFKEKEVLSFVENTFSGMKKGKKPAIEKVTEKQEKPQIKLKYKKTDQTHFILGARAFHRKHKDKYALSLLSIILGGNMSSRLFIEIRERRGLAYYVRSGIESYADCGYFGVQSGVEHKNLEKTVETILTELEKIKKEGVTTKELKKAKDYVKGKRVMNLEASDDVANFYIDQEVLKNEIMSVQEIFKKINAVTTQDIQRVAKKIFKPGNLNLAVIGPHKNKAKLEKTIL